MTPSMTSVVASITLSWDIVTILSFGLFEDPKAPFVYLDGVGRDPWLQVRPPFELGPADRIRLPSSLGEKEPEEVAMPFLSSRYKRQ